MLPILALHWGPGHEAQADLKAAAAQVRRSLDTLREHVGITTTWSTGDTDLLDEASIEDALRRGVSLNEETQEPIPDLGHHLYAYTGEGDDYAVLEVRLGGWDPTWRGTFYLQLSRPAPDRSQAIAAVKDLVEIWQPEEAAWSHAQLVRAGIAAGVARDQLYLGWVTFVHEGKENPFKDAGVPAAGGTIHVLAPSWDEMTPQAVHEAMQR